MRGWLLVLGLSACSVSSGEDCPDKPGTLAFCAGPRCRELDGLEGTYELCREEDLGVRYSCRDDVVWQENLYVAGWCQCDGDEVVYTAPPEPAYAAWGCEHGCDPSRPNVESADRSVGPQIVCRTTDTCEAPEPSPPVACGFGDVEACESVADGTVFRCDAGVVRATPHEWRGYCRCGEALPSCEASVPVGEPTEATVCDAACRQDGESVHVHDEPFDPASLCASPAP
jgi:hypothetical protein